LLISLEARVRLKGVRGEREILLSEMYRDDGIEYLNKARDEILTEVIVPRHQGVRAGYLKLRRRGSFDFPALGVAGAVKVNEDGTCESAKVVLGAVTSKPLDMPQGIQARPLQLADYTHSYRKQMVSVYVDRLLSQLTS
jgi:CO/xanthine dehydrogenase FAD-binding subunit